MSVPPLLTGAALLFWGRQTEAVPAALALALVLEGARLIPWRWELSREHFSRVSDLCMVVFLGTVVYQYAARDAALAIMAVVQWLPLAYFPLAVAQAASAAGRVDLAAISLILRRQEAAEGRRSGRTVDIGYPFFAVCLLAAAAANTRTPGFYPGLVLLSGWALWPARSRRFPAFAWAGLVTAAALLGFGGHRALSGLQEVLERSAFAWYFEYFRVDADPYRSMTAIGLLGELKLSDRILLRVRPGPGARLPLLLREASFTAYRSSVWYAPESGFGEVAPGAEGTTWELGPSAEPKLSVAVSAYLPRGRGLLALPNGAFRVEGLPVASLEKNRLGAVKVAGGPALAAYAAVSGPGGALDAPPGPEDLKLPPAEAPVLSRIAAELRLAARPPADRLPALAGYFERGFRYSTYKARRERGLSPLTEFLLKSRSGHCEYFAAAAVLLLRAAGVPARYATGYSVQEHSRLEGAFVVRDRHAHSWALAFVDGAWRDFDATPAVWAEAERQLAPPWEAVRDFLSWAAFRLMELRRRRTQGGHGLAAWLLALPALWVAWRVYSGWKAARVRPGQDGKAAPAGPGLDSEWYGIERRLSETGMGRRSWEPVTRWLERIASTSGRAVPMEGLRALSALHCRLRFDPAGLGAAERAALKAGAAAWLERHQASAPGE